MPKVYSTRLIKRKRSYTYKDIADLFAIHVRTVQEWRKEGLNILSESNPYLVMGRDLINFLNSRQKKRKVSLKPNEFYCVTCRKAVLPVSESIKEKEQAMLGGGAKSISKEAICLNCKNKIFRFGSSKKMDSKVTKRDADREINGVEDSPLKHLHSLNDF